MKKSQFFPQKDLENVKGTKINNRTMDDIISSLPLELRYRLLSFLPTNVAALTSSLSKAWRDEFCKTSTLKLMLDNDTADLLPFISFVNRILDVRGLDHPLQKFRLTLNREIYEHEADQGNLLFRSVSTWICSALGKGVTVLKLRFFELPNKFYRLPEIIFVSSSLVELSISASHHAPLFYSDVTVRLPSLKTLRLDMVDLGDEGQGFCNLLRGCPVIEELEMKDLVWFSWPSCSVSSSSLKKLSICWDYYEPEDERHGHHRPASVSFLTPSLEYLEYDDDTAGDYPALVFSSLAEAQVRLHLREDEDEDEDEDELEIPEEKDADASAFMHAISNVKKLCLHADTLQVLAFGCRTILPFPNLNELIIESHHQDQLSDWDSLPVLLNNCPQLHTLVFMGLTHQTKNTCGSVCGCEGGMVSERSCLKASSVKVLKIYDFGQAALEMDRFVATMRHFLVNMPHLERAIVYCDGSAETHLNLSRRIRKIQREAASTKCTIQVFEC